MERQLVHYHLANRPTNACKGEVKSPVQATHTCSAWLTTSRSHVLSRSHVRLEVRPDRSYVKELWFPSHKARKGAEALHSSQSSCTFFKWCEPGGRSASLRASAWHFACQPLPAYPRLDDARSTVFQKLQTGGLEKASKPTKASSNLHNHQI